MKTGLIYNQIHFFTNINWATFIKKSTLYVLRILGQKTAI